MSIPMIRPGRARFTASRWLIPAALTLLPACQRSVSPVPPGSASVVGSKDLYVIRLEDPGEAADPENKAVRDGLKSQGLTETADYTFIGRRAGGDPAKLASLVEEALAAKPGAIVTLDPEATLAAVDRSGDLPVIFGMAADPVALGLGESFRDHRANVTGAFLGFDNSMLLPIVRGSVPGAQAIGIAFNPDDPASVAHKDALIREDPRAKVVTAEIGSAQKAPEVVKSLVEQGAGALALVSGLGEAEGAMMEAARAAKVPVFGFTEAQVRSGAILSRIPDARWLGFEAGRRAARVLKGEKPGGIEFVHGAGYLTSYNPKAAEALGVRILGEALRDAKKVE